MSERRAYTFQRPVESDLFDLTFAVGQDACSSIVLMMQDRRNIDDEARRVLAVLEPFLLSSEDVSEWPGTQLLSGTARRLTYLVDPAVVDAVRAASRRLSDWINPHLPEDLHMLRSDGSVWFASTTHEHDAWLELTDAEWGQLRATHPDLARALRADDPVA